MGQRIYILGFENQDVESLISKSKIITIIIKNEYNKEMFKTLN